ncbi:cobalt transporter CbiM [Clostridium magnum]|uniref:Fused nickel transport protein NikMN n=1 Tax=Clostridium magnum DSM 2767 TaxID=1121326 RepID=A0A162U7K3_9CLOT|nr:cobalt transporter CbiM [Clostridium magnum]KZL93623.1 fused nickel transport protein NikMN [Clostridium magnum DSM 2767]SHI57355.1 cobalt/nickel transport system permease protein [Clostridium magnum DSM 2767]
MHIPDNYLSPSTCVVIGAGMVSLWRKAVIKIKEDISRKKIPMLGVCAAFSFLIMMFNVPLPGGTTGHAVGGTLVAILLGPYAAMISITTALLIQALFFGDGGILTFVVNAFNMAFIMPFVGYFIFRIIKNRVRTIKGEYIAAFIASYISINIAALSVGFMLGIQPILFRDNAGLPLYCPYPLKIAIPAMMLPHLLVVGVLEGLITMGIYAYIKKISAGTIYEDKDIKTSPICILIVALICLSPLGVLASGTAWGEWNKQQLKQMLGYVPQGIQKGFSFNAVMQSYSLAGVSNVVGYIVSAIIGVLFLLILFKILKSIKY